VYDGTALLIRVRECDELRMETRKIGGTVVIVGVRENKLASLGGDERVYWEL